TGGDHAVQRCRHVAGSAWLLAGQAEISAELRLSGIAWVVNLGHPVRAPPWDPRAQVGDASITLPPALVRTLEPVQPRHEHGLRATAGVPDLMGRVPEGAQHINFGGAALGQGLAVADPHHLRAACLVLSLLARDMREILGVAWIGDVDERSAI